MARIVQLPACITMERGYTCKGMMPPRPWYICDRHLPEPDVEKRLFSRLHCPEKHPLLRTDSPRSLATRLQPVLYSLASCPISASPPISASLFLPLALSPELDARDHLGASHSPSQRAVVVTHDKIHQACGRSCWCLQSLSARPLSNHRPMC